MEFGDSCLNVIKAYLAKNQATEAARKAAAAATIWVHKNKKFAKKSSANNAPGNGLGGFEERTQRANQRIKAQRMSDNSAPDAVILRGGACSPK